MLSSDTGSLDDVPTFGEDVNEPDNGSECICETGEGRTSNSGKAQYGVRDVVHGWKGHCIQCQCDECPESTLARDLVGHIASEWSTEVGRWGDYEGAREIARKCAIHRGAIVGLLKCQYDRNVGAAGSCMIRDNDYA